MKVKTPFILDTREGDTETKEAMYERWDHEMVAPLKARFKLCDSIDQIIAIKEGFISS